MRAVCSVLVLLVLGGCQKEPSFDERYAETQKEIGEKSRELDRELAGEPAAQLDEDAPE